ncbi:MAG TPA: mechanosensitive ion channel domain-containing protein [Bryobacteraceae bacterium]|nr:mechanosensitive ion channel domain-containing protein [Bryobacteraceae bacterium]
MGNVFQLVGPHQVVQLFGVKLVGVNAENGKKLLFSLVFIAFVMLLGRFLRWLAHRNAWDRASKRFAFWTHQGISIAVTVVLIVGIVSLWFDNPSTLTTAAGMVTAGLAFALQKVVTAFAGYLVILRGKTFTVGDRITMGGIRGDVIALSFLQTVIMEMGEPAEGDAADAAWVQARQYTGRIVRVTNAVIFDKPVYNYTREFPYIWEEMRIPVPYSADRKRAEQILLDAARKHTVKIAEIGEEALRALELRYVLKRSELEPLIYWRLTDNWIEMTVRFIVPDAGIRTIKSKMSRDIIEELDRAGIPIASGTYEVVGMPPIKVQMVSSNGSQPPSVAAPEEVGAKA